MDPDCSRVVFLCSFLVTVLHKELAFSSGTHRRRQILKKKTEAAFPITCQRMTNKRQRGNPGSGVSAGGGDPA